MSTADVLVVDDEADIRELIQEILTDEGYEVTVSASAAEARQAADKNKFDLVLLDIWMPETDGITLLREWSEQGARPGSRLRRVGAVIDYNHPEISLSCSSSLSRVDATDARPVHCNTNLTRLKFAGDKSESNNDGTHAIERSFGCASFR